MHTPVTEATKGMVFSSYLTISQNFEIEPFLQMPKPLKMSSLLSSQAIITFALIK